MDLISQANMAAVARCQISKAVPFRYYLNEVNKGKEPTDLYHFRDVKIMGNTILEMLLSSVNMFYTVPSFMINNTWYQFHFVGMFGNKLRFAQTVVSPPGVQKTKIKSVRYVDVVFSSSL